MKNSGKKNKPKPKIIPRPSHNVSRDEISRSALKVLYRLHKSGYQAFLVGGGVRDALLGLHPKDFDIATDASPDEVRALFSNCRLIGRRFRLAHVRFGREIIEVATFRAATDGNEKHVDVEHDHEGRILRDNVYGSIDEDVWRRDFTCNALYYNIADFSIWDYVDGVKDIERRRLELIGDPDTRLREDPVRMLRAVRFSAKLNFHIAQDVEESMVRNRDLLTNVPPARLFDEFLKMFQAGYAEKVFEELRRYKLFGLLFPETDKAMDEDENFLRFARIALANTDQRIAEEKSVTPMFLLGVFLWEPVKLLAHELRSQEKMSVSQSLSLASFEIAGKQQSRISIPRRFTAPMREMLAMQPRFDVTSGKRGLRLLEHRRFRAAYDFMMLRAECGEIHDELADFWTQVQKQGAAERQASFKLGDKPRSKKRRKPRRRRRPGANTA
ncbi:MAG: polynucleotide adenylyltransferase PcnB [Woeseiaceae bacterium]